MGNRVVRPSGTPLADRLNELPEPTWQLLLRRGLPQFAFEGLVPVLASTACGEQQGWGGGRCIDGALAGDRRLAAAPRPTGRPRGGQRAVHSRAGTRRPPCEQCDRVPRAAGRTERDLGLRLHRFGRGRAPVDRHLRKCVVPVPSVVPGECPYRREFGSSRSSGRRTASAGVAIASDVLLGSGWAVSWSSRS